MTQHEPHIVLLGNTGFVGHALQNYFKQLGLRVTAFGSSELDLCSSTGCKRLKEIVDIDAVLIIACRSKEADRMEQFAGDVEISRNISLCIQKNPIRKCVYFSTLSVYDDSVTNLEISESTLIQPSSIYGVAKFTAESLLRVTSENLNIPFLSFRPCKVYGPGDHQMSYGPTSFTHSALAGKKITMYGDGTELRDRLFIQDLVRIVAEMSLGEHFGIYNLASGISMSFAEIATLVQSTLGETFEIKSIPRTGNKIDQEINIKKLDNALKNLKFTSMEDGLKHYFDSFRR